eukprot:13938455-Alexandrium_andersonii.AAC.1
MLRYAPGIQVGLEPWATAKSGIVVARRYAHPASLAAVAGCWAAARVPAAGAADFSFDPRAAGEVMELAGPELAQEAAGLAAGPLRM